ncbi:HPr family phosphocarrier protein [Cohnella sp.]|uniref:HPr family phosphocarrier protein n=1 Tax=Cohnella sp. TaxID=1883426 RepID=UPI0035697A94
MGGIEIRAIVEINRNANLFKSSIVLHVGNKCIDVKSILGLTVTLAKDYEYRLEIHGPDEAYAEVTMKEIFKKHGLQVTMID